MRFKNLEPHLSHDLVIGLLQDPMSKTVLTCSLTRDEIDVRDRHVCVRVTAVTVEVHNNVARRVRRDLLRQCIGSVSDDPRRARITRIELVSGEALNDHQGLVLSTSALEHRLDGRDRVVRVTEVRTPCSRTRLLHIRRLPVMCVHNRCSSSYRRRLLRDTHDPSSFAIARSVAVARLSSSI